LILIIIIRNNLRRSVKTAKTLEYILGTIIITQIPFQLIVDGGIRRNDKKVLDAVLGIQIGNKCAHQSCLANASSEGKGQRHEITLKIGADRVHSVDSTKGGFQIHTLAEHNAVYDVLQNFERFLLRFTQGHDATDIVRGVLRKIII